MSRRVHSAKFDADALAKAFGRGVRIVRKQKGIRQTDILVDTGLTQQTISNIEIGRTSPSLVSAVAIACSLGVPVDRIVRIGLEAKE